MTATHDKGAAVLATAIQKAAGEAQTSVVGDLVHGLLVLLVETLEKKPELAQRLQAAVNLGVAGAGQVAVPVFMSVKEYAAYARLCDRTVRGFMRQGMSAGVHYHRDGRSGRRVIIHVEAADRWRSERFAQRQQQQKVDELATHEVARQRARAALRKTRGQR